MAAAGSMMGKGLPAICSPVKQQLQASIVRHLNSCSAAAATPSSERDVKAQLQLVVASKNMVKANAAKAAITQCFPHLSLQVHHQEAASGVPDQPFGDEQTLQGARNRAEQLCRSYPNSLVVAIEGGVGYAQHAMSQQSALQGSGSKTLECFAWVVVKNGAAGAESVARSGSFLLPNPVSDLVLQGMELGAADDQVFQRVASGRGSGTVGYLSQGLITREAYYTHAVHLALLPYMNPVHYGPAYSLESICT